jgi:hypothetical protein
MRRTMLAVMVGCLLLLGTFPASAGKACVVTVWQYGLQSASNSIQVSNYFNLQGTGFKTWTPVKVCLTGQLCTTSDVNSDGSFVQQERLDYPGTYQIWVYQQKTRSGGNLDLMWSGSVTVGQ